MYKYAVVITFSFDSQVSVLLFDEYDKALTFMRNDVLDEYRIDTEENGWNVEYVIYENEGRAVLTDYFDDYNDVTEWRIGTIFEHD